MFGKYTTDALRGISGERTEKAVASVERYGGNVQSMYTLLGEHDLVLIVEFPGVEEAMMASVDLQKLTGITFSTSPVVSVEQFDKMIGEAKEI
jgi:uncharacterized protein with GYD domain